MLRKEYQGDIWRTIAIKHARNPNDNAGIACMRKLPQKWGQNFAFSAKCAARETENKFVVR